MLKGFGKNYFRLVAIQAYSSSLTLQSRISAFCAVERFSHKESEIADEDDPPTLEILQATPIITTKPCHCNCFFNHKARLATLLFHFIPRCRFYNKFFAFRRTGTHPPII